MKFKFFSAESRIYDFLEFPRLIYGKEILEENQKNQICDKLTDDNYLDFISRIENKLKPYSNEIEIFYSKQYLNNYDFISLFTNIYSIFNYNCETDYLNMLLSLSEQDIKKCLVYSIITSEQEQYNSSDEAMIIAEKISSDSNEMISFIKDLPIASGCKWNLFLIVENPIKYMKLYFELMTKLLPVFHEIYAPFEEEINSYGCFLVDYLNNNGPNSLAEMTYSILDYKVLEDEITNILISSMFPYNISIYPENRVKFIAWGLKMEEAFRRMKEINENKTIERVQIFKMLGDKTRYEVLKLLASGVTSTKAIANTLGVSSATISYHLNAFTTSKIIKLNKKDNKLVYDVDYKLLEQIINDFKLDLNFPAN